MGVLLLVSLVGYLFAYNVFVRRDEAFFPVVFCSFTVAVSFILGLIGPLFVAPYLVVGIGVVLLPVSLIRSEDVRSLLLRSLVHPVVLFMVFGGIWAYVITRGVGISHRDDLSHWYRMCKALFYDGSFPRTPDITFVSYVPGTGLFAAFVSRFLGFCTSNCFFAQSFIDLSCCASLLAVIPSSVSRMRKAVLYICVCLVSVFLCALDVSTYCLLVDCTIGLVAMAAGIYVLSRDSFSVVDLVTLSLMFTLLVLIKTSGLLLCVFVLALLLRSSGKKGVLVLAVPLLFVVLYFLRQRYFYPDIGMSDQSVSVERFSSLAGGKSSSLITGVLCDTFIKALPVIGRCAQVNIFWICMVAWGLVEYKSSSKSSPRRFTLYFIAVYFIYTACLAGTYVFSMNEEEAAGLACYYRYMGTAVVYISGLVCYLILKRIGGSSDKARLYGTLGFVSAVVVVSNVLLSSGYVLGYRSYVPVEAYSTGAWEGISSYVPENTSYSSAHYVVVWDDDIVFDDGVLGHKVQELAEAYLRSDNVYTLTYNYIDRIGLSGEAEEALSSADYIVVVGQVDDRISSLGGYTSSGTVVSGINE